ncbi:hypothetical protein HORIV_71110 [Vreelandella olivaria]|uniref:Vanillate O-demethylase oxygenase-like C-terminal catalytic domain-containing protein n=1 Tax=Vreelandella olivaria TaxID=390919 RepID=A0ABM7GV91_9GAMM|nr:hypothetical protein HORIV_71110 [Halomonas olivaria]
MHASSIGQPEIEEAAPETTVNGDEVVTSREMENIPAPPFWQAALRGNGLADDVPVDRWQICRFTPPAMCTSTSVWLTQAMAALKHQRM